MSLNKEMEEMARSMIRQSQLGESDLRTQADVFKVVAAWQIGMAGRRRKNDDDDTSKPVTFEQIVNRLGNGGTA